MHGVRGGGEEVVEVVGEVEVGDCLSGELVYMIMVKKGDLLKVCLIVREVHDPWNHGTKSRFRSVRGTLSICSASTVQNVIRIIAMCR